MKIKVTIKDPDRLHHAVSEALESTRPDNLSDGEWEEVKELRQSTQMDLLRRFVEFGEYFRIEFDTEAMTATVLDVR